MTHFVSDMSDDQNQTTKKIKTTGPKNIDHTTRNAQKTDTEYSVQKISKCYVMRPLCLVESQTLDAA